MRTLITAMDPTDPVVNVTGPDLRVQHLGYITDRFRLFMLQVQQGGLLISDTTELGGATPESVVEAQQGTMLMVEDGLAGAVLYIKQKADIGGDRTQGWIAIG